jgi:UDP-N-acetylglucosamine 2-epimerase (non-hydrolysing)
MSHRKLTFIVGVKDEIYTLASVLMQLSRANFPFSVIDISEEKGWFEKGKQYLTLEYPKPNHSIKFRLESIDDMKNELMEFIINNEIDLVITCGASYSSLLAVTTCNEIGVTSINIDSGVRSYNISDKNEVLRQLIDQYASIRMTSLPTSTHNLINEGIEPNTIFLTGHPIADLVIRYIDRSLNSSTIHNELDIEKRKYIMLYIDRDSSLPYIDKIINITQNNEMPIIVPIDPDLRVKLEEEDKYIKYMMDYDILFTESLDYIDHLSLLYHSKYIYTDNDVVAIESSVLSKSVYFLGDYFRAELIDGGWVYNFREDKRIMDNETRARGSSLELLGGGLASENIVNKIYALGGVSSRKLGTPKLYIRSDGKVEVHKGEIGDEWIRWLRV